MSYIAKDIFLHLSVRKKILKSGGILRIEMSNSMGRGVVRFYAEEDSAFGADALVDDIDKSFSKSGYKRIK